MKEINKDKLVRRYMHKLIFNIKSIPISAGHPERAKRVELLGG